MGTLAERKAQMQDPELRNRLREDWDAGIRPGQNIQGSVAGLICQGVGDPEFEHYEGMTVGAIAEKENKHIVDAFLDLVVADDLKTEFEAKQYRDNAQYTAEVLHSPHVVAGLSDGGAHLKFLSNGGFPTQHLTWLVRDEQVVSLEEMHYKLSYLPAHIAGFKDRGFLREGAPADIVMYDLDKLKVLPTTIAHDLPGGEWRRGEGPSRSRERRPYGALGGVGGAPCRLRRCQPSRWHRPRRVNCLALAPTWGSSGAGLLRRTRCCRLARPARGTEALRAVRWTQRLGRYRWMRVPRRLGRPGKSPSSWP